MSNTFDQNEQLLAAERDVQARLGDRPLDFPSLQVVSNIYRAAAAIRRRAEREVLSQYRVSFGGFTILWVLWVWGEMETAQLAEECGLAKGTLTGMLTTLEKRDLVERHRLASDRRRVLVHLTPAGLELIDELYPKFNAFESEMAASLDGDEKHLMAGLLRRVIATADDDIEA
jgi:DNA-binding MarR family transcriptional regulator